ncbi:hypothetical protein AZ044_002148 [Pluralibacter gergoviae]|nr:hypothetical protein AZ034_004806 [Pluralibacter gergoviae]OUF55888.1 hypothetical protein AZ044_002148 [Pluralibacter gergoviae]
MLTSPPPPRAWDRPASTSTMRPQKVR